MIIRRLNSYKGSDEFLAVFGGIAEQRLLQEPDYGKEVYCLAPLSGACQTADSDASGEPWASFYYLDLQSKCNSREVK